MTIDGGHMRAIFIIYRSRPDLVNRTAQDGFSDLPTSKSPVMCAYGAAQKDVIPSVMHCQDQYANSRAEGSHQRTRQRERQMRRFKSPGQAQRFLSVEAQVHNVFNVGRHLLKACQYRIFRSISFDTWGHAGTGAQVHTRRRDRSQRGIGSHYRRTAFRR